ncbi:MAG TPA: cytidylate kinase-like family protein [Chthoniobacterales bacterium]|nr:cytidylate kinase-like family protein [Chthoniobacterales bacterium]
MKTSLLNRFNRYLAAQAAVPEKVHQPTPLSVTISREAGAGGTTIAEILADRLSAVEQAPASRPWAVFDAELARQVLEDHKLPPQLERLVTEETKLPIEEVVEELLGLHPTRWTLVQHTTKTILKLVSLGHAVIVGRGSHEITARLPNVVHIRLVAPLSTRLRYFIDRYKLTSHEAEKMLRDRDESRRRYLRTYFNADVEDPTRHDLIINTGRLGYTDSADLIYHLVMQRQKAIRSGELPTDTLGKPSAS